MGVGEDFREFVSHLAIRDRESISTRYQLITRRLNLEFWNLDSHTSHSFYTGSYGRGTAISLTSDVAMLFSLPNDLYFQYDAHQGNGQSSLLQSVRAAIQKTYPSTSIGADGQVVVVPFNDGITFEVLPAFLNQSDSYTFPEATGGGSWKTTNPKPEIDAMATVDAGVNGNLKNLAKMMRSWKAQWDVPIGGLLIDTLGYAFIQTWGYRDKSYLYYDFMSRDFFDYLASQDPSQQYWKSPGAGQYVLRKGNFEYKATRCRNIATDAIDADSKGHTFSARRYWREVYGTSYPG